MLNGEVMNKLYVTFLLPLSSISKVSQKNLLITIYSFGLVYFFQHTFVTKKSPGFMSIQEWGNLFLQQIKEIDILQWIAVPKVPPANEQRNSY